MSETQQPAKLLAIVTGRDRPGVTSALFETLGRYDVRVVDVEQVVIRDRLILGVLIDGPGADAGSLCGELRDALAPLGMEIAFERSAGDDDARRSGRCHVTVLGHPLRPAAMAAVAGRITA